MTFRETAAMTSTAASAVQPRILLPPLRYRSTPQIDLRYWVAISLASVFGCNLGDFVSLYLHLGHWVGLFPLAAAFIALVVCERRSVRASEGWYWAIVIVLRTAATNLADLATHTFGLPYPWVIAFLELLQVLVILPVGPRLSGAKAEASRPVADGWYWASLLTAGALGTAIGDGVAEDLHLGTGLGTLALGAFALLAIKLGAPSGWSTKAGYWLAIIAVRAAGTTAGDWLAFRDSGGLVNGLHLGLALSTGCTGGVFALTLLLWRPKSTASTAPQP